MAPKIPTILLTARSPLEAVKRVGSLLLYVARLNKTNKAIAARQTATISLVLWSNLGDIHLAMRNLVLSARSVRRRRIGFADEEA